MSYSTACTDRANYFGLPNLFPMFRDTRVLTQFEVPDILVGGGVPRRPSLLRGGPGVFCNSPLPFPQTPSKSPLNFREIEA